MVLDECYEPESIGHGLLGRDLARLVGAERAPRLGLGQEPLEELVSRPEMDEWDRPRFTIDVAGLDKAVVGMSPDFDTMVYTLVMTGSQALKK
jgi:hypothetical protein